MPKLHHPIDEVEVAFAVLDRVLQLVIGTGQLDGEMRRTHLRPVFEHLFEDLDHGHVVEHPVVAPLGHDPGPGAEREVIEKPVLGDIAPTRIGHDTIEILWPVKRAFDDHGHMGADQLIEIDVVVL